ncbi:hypothetical protein Leryth_023560 [Lithospermum erythrorhizon]|nr:hypothetical protein Leryth_023560 [Lithospermum erythrorhizon]
MSGITQDWEPVVIRKKAPTAAAPVAGTNRAASSSTTLNTRKLDEDTENLSHEKVPTELKKALMQGRMDKKLTQSQLAQLSICPLSIASPSTPFLLQGHNRTNTLISHCVLQLINEKPQIIQEYESGKAIPNQQIISKLERALGVKLRGKK